MAKKTTDKKGKKTPPKKETVKKSPKTRTAEEVVRLSEDIETVSIPRKHFTLATIKIMKDNRGVEVSYRSVKMDGGISSVDVHSVSSHGVPHPDLIKSIEKLSPYAVQACGLVKYLKSDEISQEYAEKALSQAIESYAPTGISINGQDAKKKAIITGVWGCFGNYKISMNTPNILIDQNQFEFEDELSISLQEIEDEVFAYLFKNKGAQLDIFHESASTKKRNSDDLEESELEEEEENADQTKIHLDHEDE